MLVENVKSKDRRYRRGWFYRRRSEMLEQTVGRVWNLLQMKTSESDPAVSNLVQGNVGTALQGQNSLSSLNRTSLLSL